MGVLNVTPDSFSDGGPFLESGAAIDQGRRLVEAGAGVIDVGGESTRPGAAPVTENDERRRVIPVVEALAAAGLVVSIDTMKPGVAAEALAAGAEIVNDVGGLVDPAMRETVTGAGVVIMHMQGTPRTMQIDPTYADVVEEVTGWLATRAKQAEAAGVRPQSICLDPGIGFGKTVDHNLSLLARLDRLVELGYPVAIGVSRKAFLGRLIGVEDPTQRDLVSAVAAGLAVERGAAVIRAHDVAGTCQAVLVAEATLGARTWS